MRVLLAFVSAALIGCSSSSSGTSAPAQVTKSIGPEGGQIQVDGATVTFAANAVASAQSITIAASSDPPPDGFVALSKVYKCDPSGLNFAAQVTMAMQFTADNSPVTMFWSSGADPTFKELTNVSTSGNVMTATIQHFSSGFIGRKK